jgi:hypothetical protein
MPSVCLFSCLLGQGSGQFGLLCCTKLNTSRFLVEENECVKKICTPYLVHNRLVNNSFGGVQIVQAADRYIRSQGYPEASFTTRDQYRILLPNQSRPIFSAGYG